MGAIDSLRGLIMVIMALDHAAFFVAGRHPFEYFAIPLPDYGQDWGWFLTRWLTHLCAPGFAMLLGVGAALSGRGRAELVKRGALLVALSCVFEVLPQLAAGLVPRQDFLVIGVLVSLGFSLMAAGALQRLSTRSWLAVAFIAIMAPNFLLPTLAPAAPVGYWLRIFFVPGETVPVASAYPLLPWFGITALGVALGRMIQADGTRVLKNAWMMGLAYLVGFAGIRFGGGFGNLRVAEGGGLMGFLTVVKYPPSLAFVLLFLGLNLVLLTLLWKAPAGLQRVLSVYGQAPLFFYLTHFYVLAAVGTVLGGHVDRPVLFAVWAAVVAALYPACRWYRQFKQARPAGSLWHLV